MFSVTIYALIYQNVSLAFVIHVLLTLKIVTLFIFTTEARDIFPNHLIINYKICPYKPFLSPYYIRFKFRLPLSFSYKNTSLILLSLVRLGYKTLVVASFIAIQTMSAIYTPFNAGCFINFKKYITYY